MGVSSSSLSAPALPGAIPGTGGRPGHWGARSANPDRAQLMEFAFQLVKRVNIDLKEQITEQEERWVLYQGKIKALWLRWSRICLQCSGTWVQSLGQEDPLEEEMATRSSVLTWRIPSIEEPGGSQKIRYTEQLACTHKWGASGVNTSA